MIRRITDRERRFLARLDLPPDIDSQELARARRTLAALRATIGQTIGALHEQPQSS